MAAVVHSMNRLLLARLAGFLLLLVPAASTLAQVPGELVSKIDAIFAKWTAPDAPGVVIAVSQNGQVVLTRAYGQAELGHDLPNTEHTRFESGSVSKQFTAAAIILLAQQGKLALTDDVRKHIPEIPDYGTPITLRHLLNHTRASAIGAASPRLPAGPGSVAATRRTTSLTSSAASAV